MGGFEAPGTGTVLDFAGTQYEGLEVTVDAVSTGLMLDILEHYEAVAAEGVTMAQARPAIQALFEGFSSVLESWNVTRKGEPVPATLEGIRSLDITFVMKVIEAWISGTTSAPPELGKGSSSGGTSLEAVTAAAALSSSLPS